MPDRKLTRRPMHAMLQEIGKEVRAKYIRYRREWLSVLGSEPHYLPGKKWDGATQKSPVWPKVAKFLVENQIRDCGRFIRVIFQNRGKRKPPPQPNHLYGPVALEIWRASDSDAEVLVAIKQQWNQEKKSFAVAMMDERDYFPDMTDHERLQGVIADDVVNLSPLYRYCVAVGEGLPRHAAMFKEMALQQYIVAQRFYDEAWGGWIPELLKKDAKAACQSLLEETDGS